MHTKRLTVVVVIAIGMLLLVAGNASAASNLPAGTALSQTTDPPGADAYNFELVGFISCESSLVGSITNVYGTGLGIRALITAGTFAPCNTGSMVGNFNPPWVLDGVPVTSTLNDVVLSGVDITVTLFGSTCRYVGTLEGTFDEATDTLTLSGTLTKVSGSFLCPATVTANGTWVVSPSNLNIG